MAPDAGKNCRCSRRGCQPVHLVKTAGGREVADIYGTYLTKLLKVAR